MGENMKITDLKFTGTWRNYQARVLCNSWKYLEDGKIHIVAAPGSGKTTLGIELMIRIGEPVLILAPSITIREQWKERILEAFVTEEQKNAAKELISQDLKKPADITIATYQALHSAMTRYHGELKEKPGDTDEESNLPIHQELVDFSEFDFVQAMKNIGMRVLCLDECHHLRSEWWTALENFQKQMGDVRYIALTATPPYDSSPAEWKRYHAMCGEIDEEITIPELVKEGSLCPHQDYIYFNYPTIAEMKAVTEFQEKSKAEMKRLMESPEFFQVIQGHKLFSGELKGEDMLEEPEYLSALLIYMQEKNQTIPASLKRLLGIKKFPKMSEKWMEILLRKLLYENPQDFYCSESDRESLINELKYKGLIEKRKVFFSSSTALEKMLISSQGKAESIVSITEHEYLELGSNLRMLILTDYIRKEIEKSLGTSEEVESKLGVLPFFEKLRRFYEDKKDVEGPKLGVLCGTIVIIPADAKEKLVDLLEKKEPVSVSKVQFSRVGSISEREYVKVTAMGNSHFLTRIVTELFAQGAIQVLIGTKSLLGEGWDSPCINACILASFVGSYMLSNQMRGRAIRAMKDNPDKTSNIWHLVCVKPPKIVQKEQKEGESDVTVSEDWEMLSRRMEHFLGLDYQEDIIVNGISRLSCVYMPFSHSNINRTNKEMLAMSKERDRLKKRWKTALEIGEHIEVVEETDVKDQLITGVVFFDALRCVVVSVVLLVFMLLGGSLIAIPSLFAGGVIFLAITGIVLNCPKLIRFGSRLNRLKAIGSQMAKSMKQNGFFKNENYWIEVEHPDGIVHAIYLRGGTGWEKKVFAQCVSEFYAGLDNQKYILVHKKKKAFYCVPELFAQKKETAQEFLNCMKPCIGKYELVYTRSEEGRKWLLEGRKRAYANRQERCLSRKKVKSALE